MSKKEYMHEWLKADAVRYDLPSEEIIQQLANENESLKQQRDDLLTACRNLLIFSDCDSTCSDNKEAQSQAKAVIAKCKE